MLTFQHANANFRNKILVGSFSLRLKYRFQLVKKSYKILSFMKKWLRCTMQNVLNKRL